MEEGAATRNEWERERAEAVSLSALPSRRGSEASDASAAGSRTPRLQHAMLGVRSAVAIGGQHWQAGRGRDPDAIAAAQAAVRAQRGATYAINDDAGPVTWGIEHRRASDNSIPRRGQLSSLARGPASLPGSPARPSRGSQESSKKGGFRWSSEQIKTMMDMLPKYSFDPDKHSDDEDHKLCAICLDEYESKDDLTLLPCMHRYHSACVTSWILTDKQGQGCPMCKQSPFIGMQPANQR